MKRKCSKCKKLFEEEDLDFENGRWVCRGCEDEYYEREDEFGGVF